MQIYQLGYKGKISTLSSTHRMFHTLILSPFQPAESKWERKVKREGSRRGKTAALQRHSLHHRALLPGWRQWHAEQMSYSHYYINTHPRSHTKHTLSTWSSRSLSEALQFVLFSWGRGMKKDVLMWKNSECDRPKAGVTWGSRSS